LETDLGVFFGGIWARVIPISDIGKKCRMQPISLNLFSSSIIEKQIQMLLRGEAPSDNQGIITPFP
jgi:hypothetical protein